MNWPTQAPTRPPRGIAGNTRKAQDTAINNRQQQETTGNSRKLQETARNCKELQETARNYRNPKQDPHKPSVGPTQKCIYPRLICTCKEQSLPNPPN
eukprot:12039734-Alexandrium_andersonii.AAC.1